MDVIGRIRKAASFEALMEVIRNGPLDGDEENDEFLAKICDLQPEEPTIEQWDLIWEAAKIDSALEQVALLHGRRRDAIKT
jgi:hypothetical protein